MQKMVVAFSSTAASVIVTPNSMVRMIVSATIDGEQAVASGKGHLGNVVGEYRNPNRHPPRPHLSSATRISAADNRNHTHPHSRRAVKVAWLIYQKIIAAYADPNRRRGKQAMTRLSKLDSSAWDPRRLEAFALIDSIRRGVPAGLEEIAQLGRTLWRRRHDILAFFDHHASNGPTEAINGRLEALRRNALGFRNLAHYRSLKGWARKDTALADSLIIEQSAVDVTRFGLQVIEEPQASVTAQVIG